MVNMPAAVRCDVPRRAENRRQRQHHDEGDRGRKSDHRRQHDDPGAGRDHRGDQRHQRDGTEHEETARRADVLYCPAARQHEGRDELGAIDPAERRADEVAAGPARRGSRAGRRWNRNRCSCCRRRQSRAARSPGSCQSGHQAATTGHVRVRRDGGAASSRGRNRTNSSSVTAHRDAPDGETHIASSADAEAARRGSSYAAVLVVPINKPLV